MPAPLLSRRDWLKATTALATALGLRAQEAGAVESSAPAVIWLQAQSCSGCSVSLLNSITLATADEVLSNLIDLKYHSTLSAATGQVAVDDMQKAADKPFVLVVEGSIPTKDDGASCHVWADTTALAAVRELGQRARCVLAVGTCSAFGGIAAAAPNPTGAVPVSAVLKGKPLINIPGCPVHPDWIVATVGHLLKTGEPPPLDSLNRPTQFFRRKVHDQCPYEDDEGGRHGGHGCLKKKGCKGERTRADCPRRRWNAPAKDAHGVNWCIAAGSPCLGCTEPGFPDAMTPFHVRGKRGEGGRRRGD